MHNDAINTHTVDEEVKEKHEVHKDQNNIHTLHEAGNSTHKIHKDSNNTHTMHGGATNTHTVDEEAEKHGMRKDQNSVHTLHEEANSTNPMQKDTNNTHTVHGGATNTHTVDEEVKEKHEVHKDQNNIHTLHEEAYSTNPIQKDTNNTHTMHGGATNTHTVDEEAEKHGMRKDQNSIHTLHEEAYSTNPMQKDTNNTHTMHGGATNTHTVDEEVKEKHGMRKDQNSIHTLHEEAYSTNPMQKDTNNTHTMHGGATNTHTVDEEVKEKHGMRKDQNSIHTLHEEAYSTNPMQKDTNNTHTMHGGANNTHVLEGNNTHVEPIFKFRQAMKRKYAYKMISRSKRMWQKLIKGEKTLNMIVETPSYTNDKMHINLNKPLNPITRGVRMGGYIWNYGTLPQTWQNPDENDTFTGLKGDGHPLDVIDLGEKSLKEGDIIQVKVLAALGLNYHGKTDWKIIAINANDSEARLLNTLEDLEDLFPTMIETTINWFKYWHPDWNLTLFEKPKEKEFAYKVIAQSNKQWAQLMEGQVKAPGVSLVNTCIKGSQGQTSYEFAEDELNRRRYLTGAPTSIWSSFPETFEHPNYTTTTEESEFGPVWSPYLNKK
ncbi:hypothetical protein WDU94_000367 [Cyamophila willieti]